MPRARQPDTTVQEAAGAATLLACSSAWGWMLKVNFSWWWPFLAQRWLSLGHPPQRGTQLDYTGDIARSHYETVPLGPC